jgi:hypothetical protein
LADDAAFEITNLAKWYTLTDPSFTSPEDLAPEAGFHATLPEEFNEAWRLLWTAKAMRTFRSHEAGAAYAQEQANPAIQRAAEHYDAQFNFMGQWPQAALEDNVSMADVMRSVINIMIRQRTIVIPPFSEAARSLREEFVKLWEGGRWRFRVRHYSITIDALTASINFDEGDPKQFDGFASKHIHLLSAERGMRYKVAWLDPERFAEARTFWNSGAVTTTGVPRYFTTEDRGTLQAIHFLPQPDIDYNGFAAILIKGPTFSADPFDDTDSNGLNQMPQPFRAHLRDRLIGTLLSQWGREDVDCQRWLTKIESDFAKLADDWTEAGAEAYSARKHPGSSLVQGQLSHRGPNIIGQTF